MKVSPATRHTKQKSRKGRKIAGCSRLKAHRPQRIALNHYLLLTPPRPPLPSPPPKRAPSTFPFAHTPFLPCWPQQFHRTRKRCQIKNLVHNLLENKKRAMPHIFRSLLSETRRLANHPTSPPDRRSAASASRSCTCCCCWR